MKYLIEYFKQFRKFIGRKIYYLLFFMFIAGAIEGIGVVLFLPILQDGFGDDKLSRILSSVFGFFHLEYSFSIVLVFILIFFTSRSIFLIFYTRYFGKLYAGLIVSLKEKILSKIFQADYLYLLKKEMGYINNIITREIERVVNAFDTLVSVLNYTIFGLVYMALAMLLSLKVTFFASAFIPLFILAMMRINRLINSTSKDYASSHGRFHSLLIQTLSKLKYLKATSSNTSISRIIDRENRNLGRLNFKLFFLQALTRNIFEPLLIFTVLALLFYFVVFMGRNVSEVIFFVFLFLQLARQFMVTQQQYRKFLATTGSIEVFNVFLKELEEHREDLNRKGALPDFDKEIMFKGVTVIFPNGKKAIDNMNITIKPRSIVAFVGHSGSGKSTIANVITGLLKPTEGKIIFGYKDYREINLKVLRENIGYVTQEDVIFNASVKDNVSLWNESAGMDALDQAMRFAHITDFVKNTPQRYDALLGDNGLNISGGQRQRITIARELYKDTKLLILDEATSSLDSKSEKRIYENLKEFRGKKTMVVIAHRLSTIKNADYIYVIDEGKIIEEGRYEELVQKKGEFKKMVEEQNLIEDNGVKVGL